jgi:hypothetical protein
LGHLSCFVPGGASIKLFYDGRFGDTPVAAKARSILIGLRMSALGDKRKWCHARVMSVLPLKADIGQREVPRPQCANSRRRLVYNPLADEWALSRDTNVNYFATAMQG